MSEEHKIPEGYTFWWEPMAQGGDGMPDGLEWAEQMLYIELRGLYGQVRMKVIERQNAVREKKRLLEDYRCYQFQDGMYKKFAAAIRSTELYRAEFRKNPTIENAWKVIRALEGSESNGIPL